MLKCFETPTSRIEEILQEKVEDKDIEIYVRGKTRYIIYKRKETIYYATIRKGYEIPNFFEDVLNEIKKEEILY